MKFLKYVKKFFIILMLVIVGVLIGGTIFFYPKIKTLYIESSEKVNNIKEDTFKSSQTSLVYDSNNNMIAKLKGDKDVYYLNYKNIPEDVINIFVATEDKNFFNHSGIDIKGIGRAALNIVKNGKISGGGSTITQQLARNVFLTHETSFERKIKEIFISILLEKRYEKEELLEYYINSIYFANGVYGIEAASLKYFNKSVSELTLGEIAFISAIPNNPTLYDPLKNYDNTIKRKNRMLGYMLEDGYITQSEHDKAVKETIILDVSTIAKNNYVDTYIIDAATETLMELNGFVFRNTFKSDRDKTLYTESYNEAYSLYQKDLYSGGYRIYTSIDMEKQEALQEAVDSTLSSFTEKTSDGVYTFQGAATSIDNASGKVVAIVGGRTHDSGGYTLNRAFQSYRQPGSTFKPLVVYTPAFESSYLPSSVASDTKSDDGPVNYNHKYEGNITLRYAVEQSKNTVAWNLFNEIGPKKGLSYVKQMNFSKIVNDDYNLSASLGGLTYGTSTLEIASAYSTIARDGYFYNPTCIVKITDSTGKVIYNDSKEPVSIYTEKAARIMTDVLQSAMKYGTGRKMQLSNMPTAGKTGTTNDNKDGWFAGYTPYFTTVVWCGYDTPKSLSSLVGSSYPGTIWKKYMEVIHKNLPYKEFARYEGLRDDEFNLSQQLILEESQKVLVDEIDGLLSVFSNKEVNSLDDIYSLDELYTQLLSKIDGLIDEEKKSYFMSIINSRKEYIDNMRDSFTTPEEPPVTPEVPETPVVPETPEISPEEPPSEDVSNPSTEDESTLPSDVQ